MVTAASGLFLTWILWPFLPREPVPTLNLELVRLSAGEKPYSLTNDRIWGDDLAAEVKRLSLHGEAHGGIGSFSGGTGNTRIGVLLIALEPIDQEYRLALPKEGYVVYVLQNHHWTPHPDLQGGTRGAVVLKPDGNSAFDGGLLRVRDEKNFSPFTWYPPIPRGH